MVLETTTTSRLFQSAYVGVHRETDGKALDQAALNLELQALSGEPFRGSLSK